MKKRLLLSALLLVLTIVFAFSLTACNKEIDGTLETLKNDYGVTVDGGSFETGSSLVCEPVTVTEDEGKQVLKAIEAQSYNKEGNVYIYDIYVTKDDAKVQPNG